MNPLPLAWAELRRHSISFILMAVLIALSVGTGIGLSVYLEAFTQGANRAAAPFDLIIGAAGSETQLILTTVFLQPAALTLLPAEMLENLAKDPGVVFAAPIALGDSADGYAVVGTSAALLSALANQSGNCEPHSSAYVCSPWAANSAVMGASVALKVGHTFEVMHGFSARAAVPELQHHSFPMTITSRLPPTGSPWDKAILIPIDTIWAMHSPNAAQSRITLPIAPRLAELYRQMLQRVPAMVVKPRSVADAYRLRQKYRDGSTLAVFPAEVLLKLYQTLGNAADLVTGLITILLLVVALTVLLSITILLLATRPFLAVLRALGAPAGFIFAQTWVQVCAVLLGGIVLGLPLGWLMAVLFGRWFESVSGLVLHAALGPKELAWVAALALSSLLLALLPAVVVYRVPLEKALRS
jgi:putative ABC transport system permease protein